MRKFKYDYRKVQEFYNKGNTWRDVLREFGMASKSLHLAMIRGDFIPRNKSAALKLNLSVTGPRKLSSSTKKKISASRIKYLEANPSKVPYLLNHSSKKSYPEVIFESALIKAGITGWEYGFQHSIYQYDFAFPQLKIDVEIDGSTHRLEKVKKIDKRRDRFSKKHGWKVIRFDAQRVKTNTDDCIRELQAIINQAP